MKIGSKFISSVRAKAVEKMISSSKESISQTSKAFMVEFFKRTLQKHNSYYIHIPFSSDKKEMLGALVLILHLLKKLYNFLSSVDWWTHFQLDRNDIRTSVQPVTFKLPTSVPFSKCDSCSCEMSEDFAH